MPTALDEIDKRILRVLQRDGRMQNNDLAKAVGLSPSPCLRRVRLLEEEHAQLSLQSGETKSAAAGTHLDAPGTPDSRGFLR